MKKAIYKEALQFQSLLKRLPLSLNIRIKIQMKDHLNRDLIQIINKVLLRKMELAGLQKDLDSSIK